MGLLGALFNNFFDKKDKKMASDVLVTTAMQLHYNNADEAIWKNYSDDTTIMYLTINGNKTENLFDTDTHYFNLILDNLTSTVAFTHGYGKYGYALKGSTVFHDKKMHIKSISRSMMILAVV